MNKFQLENFQFNDSWGTTDDYMHSPICVKPKTRKKQYTYV